MNQLNLEKAQDTMVVAQTLKMLRWAAKRALFTPLGWQLVERLTRRDIQKYRETHAVHKLHLGCGPRLLPEWLNADLPTTRHVRRAPNAPIGVDCSKALPIDSDSLDFVYSEHMHEHLPYRDGARLAGEMFRILKPNGRVRIAIPDLEFLMAMMKSERSYEEYCRALQDHIEQTDGTEGAPVDKTTFLNLMFRGFQHRYLYSRESLQKQLENVGFVDVVVRKPGESDFPDLQGLETNPLDREGILEMHVSYTIALEARKPDGRVAHQTSSERQEGYRVAH